jgi:hypothetical protein
MAQSAFILNKCKVKGPESAIRHMGRRNVAEKTKFLLKIMNTSSIKNEKNGDRNNPLKLTVYFLPNFINYFIFKDSYNDNFDHTVRLCSKSAL